MNQSQKEIPYSSDRIQNEEAERKKENSPNSEPNKKKK